MSKIHIKAERPPRRVGMLEEFMRANEAAAATSHTFEGLGPCLTHPDSGRYPTGACVACIEDKWNDLMTSLRP